MKHRILLLLCISIIIPIISFADSNNVELVGSYNTPDWTRSVYVVGNYAYIVDESNGLYIMDVSDPKKPSNVGHYSSSEVSKDSKLVYYNKYKGMCVSGNYAYLCVKNKLYIIDISNPTQPHEAGHYVVPQFGNIMPTPTPSGVYVIDECAYIIVKDLGLYVVNVSDPAKPYNVIRNNFISCFMPDVSGVVDIIHVVKNYVYVAAAERNPYLYVFDVSNPASPRKINWSYDRSNAFVVALGVYVVGDKAYVAAGKAGLRIVDVSSPEKPYELGYYDISTTEYVSGVYVAGSYAYIADMSGKLRVIDISDPKKPNEVGFCDIPGHASGVYVANEYAYVTYSYVSPENIRKGGLCILRYVRDRSH